MILRAFIFLACIFFSFSFSCMAVEKRALDFNKWKSTQVVKAQNRVVRLSNRLHIINSRNFKLEGGSQDPQVEMESEIAKNQKNLEKALEALQHSKELGLEEYVLIHLSQFKENPATLTHLAQKMPAEEMALILAHILKTRANQ